MRLSASDWEYVEERVREFTGREWVFERVRKFLDGNDRLLVLVAPPGTGKTAIAARLAQASAERLPAAEFESIPSNTLDAAVFCRAGRVSLLGVAQDLADQLQGSRSGFAAEQLAAVAGRVTVSEVTVQTGDVAPGARVAAVRVDLAGLGPELAFEDGLALPLRRLADSGGRPAILLVDALDEAYASAAARQLPALLAALGGVRLIVTTRDDPRVLAAIRTHARPEDDEVIDLIRDAPPAGRDIEDYARTLLQDHGLEGPMRILAHRIAAAANDNFLYARVVTSALIEAGNLRALDTGGADETSLPAGGLAGVYRDFFGRELGHDEERWRTRVRPILGPLAVAQGDGLDATQLAAIASEVVARPVSSTEVRDVTRLAGQFLEGWPNGPFRPFHRSFADFLLDSVGNPDWRVDPQDANAAITIGLRRVLPHDTQGQVDWANADAYTRSFLAVHAAASGLLDELVTDAGFLGVADPGSLWPLLPRARSDQARAATKALERSLHFFAAHDSDAFSYLELAARQTHASELLRSVEHHSVPRRWRPRWVSAPTSMDDGIVGRHETGSLSLVSLRDRVVAVSAGRDGSVHQWDLARSVPWARPLEAHPSNAVATVLSTNGRHRLVTGGSDGRLSVWDLDPLGSRDDVATGLGAIDAIAMGSIDAEPVVVVAHERGDLSAWSLRDRAALWKVPAVDGEYFKALTVTDLTGAAIVVSVGKNLYRDGSQIRRRDLRTGSELGEPFTGDWSSPDSIAIVRRRGRAVIAVATYRPMFVDLETGDVVESGQHPALEVVSTVEIAGQPVIVAGTGEGAVAILDIDTGMLQAELQSYDGAVVALAALDVGNRSLAVTASETGTLRIWDLTKAVESPLPPASEATHVISVVALARSGGAEEIVVTAGADAMIRTWDLESGAQRAGAWQAFDRSRISGMATADTGADSIVVTAGATGVIRVWAMPSRSISAEATDSSTHSVAIGVVGDRHVLASAGLDNRTFTLRWLADLSLVAEPFQPDLPPSATGRYPISDVAVGWFGNQPLGVQATRDGEVVLYDLVGRRELLKLKPGLVPIRVAVADLAGNLVIGGTFEDGLIVAWNLSTSERRVVSGTARAWTLGLGVANGRPVVLSGDDFGLLRVLDIADNGVDWSIDLAGQLGHIQTMAIAPPATLIAGTMSGLAALELISPG